MKNEHIGFADLLSKSSSESLNDAELYELGRHLAHLVPRGKEHKFLRGFAHECSDLGTDDVRDVIGDAIDVLQEKYSYLDDDREDPDSTGADLENEDEDSSLDPYEELEDPNAGNPSPLEEP